MTGREAQGMLHVKHAHAAQERDREEHCCRHATADNNKRAEKLPRDASPVRRFPAHGRRATGRHGKQSAGQPAGSPLRERAFALCFVPARAASGRAATSQTVNAGIPAER